MLISNIIGIIADDLTGANDTALQFHSKGCNTEIILDYKNLPQTPKNVGAWAVSTESRNIDAKTAAELTYNAVLSLRENLSVELFYKKIDSTLRGNVAPEIVAALSATKKDAAIIAPAFIQEGRITIGGYQLVKGVPIERTEAARDPHAPIYESSIPNILKRQLNDDMKNEVALIEHSIVTKGAGPIALKINELVKAGKKFIVTDAVSITDIEQIVLAMKKCSYNVLPCGSAGLAQALASTWVDGVKPLNITKKLPPLPKLVLSGSATQLSTLQIKKLQFDDDLENTYLLNLRLGDILDGLTSLILQRVILNLVKNNIVMVHVGEIENEIDDENSKQRERLIDEGISREDLAYKITDYLSELLQEVKKVKDFILVTIGGETSFKCCKALGAEFLQVIDAVLPSIPLCMDANAQLLITKSGNLGSSNTLIEIMKYFKDHG